MGLFDSNTSSTSNATDMRVVGGQQSANLSAQASNVASGGALSNVLNAQNSNVVMNTGDYGAIAGGLELATRALDTNAALATSSNANAGSMFAGALGAVSDANQRLALAYQSGQAGDQVQLKYAGFVVVGLAAFMLLKR